MTEQRPKLALIGFGEAASAFVEGWRGALPEDRLPGIRAYDIQPDDPVEICRDGADLVLRGTAHRVLDGASATLIVVEAGGSAALLDTRVDSVQDRIIITPRPALDCTRPLATLHFDDLEKRLEGRRRLERLLRNVPV